MGYDYMANKLRKCRYCGHPHKTNEAGLRQCRRFLMAELREFRKVIIPRVPRGSTLANECRVHYVKGMLRKAQLQVVHSPWWKRFDSPPLVSATTYLDDSGGVTPGPIGGDSSAL